MKHSNKTPLIVASVMMACGVALITYGCLNIDPHYTVNPDDQIKRQDKQPVYVEYFKQGQILLPDYVCPDTMIVIDAIGLNKAMGLIEQGFTGQDFGDAQYDSLFHQYCTVK
jgi:hypothetical protein